MRMSDEEYFRSCVAKERLLAQLLGHHNLEEFYESAGSLWENAQMMPQWTRDWKACAPLIADYQLAIVWHPADDNPSGPTVQVNQTVVHVSDHPDRDQAVRMAIVKAVIAHLEHCRHH